MHDVVKLKYRTARLWITYVLRLAQYLVLLIGGLYGLIQPPDTIVDSMGRPIITGMALCLIAGAALCFAGWGFGRWALEQYGSVVAAVGAIIYFWATVLSPNVLSLGGGLRTSLTFFVVLTLTLRIFDIERYTARVTIPGRIRLES